MTTEKWIDKLIEQHKDKFNTTTMFGVPISELDGDELRACICVLGEDAQTQRNSMQQERDMYKLFRSKGL